MRWRDCPDYAGEPFELDGKPVRECSQIHRMGRFVVGGRERYEHATPKLCHKCILPVLDNIERAKGEAR